MPSEAHSNEKTAFAAFPSQQEGSDLAFCVKNCTDCTKRAESCQVSSVFKLGGAESIFLGLKGFLCHES